MKKLSKLKILDPFEATTDTGVNIRQFNVDLKVIAILCLAANTHSARAPLLIFCRINTVIFYLQVKPKYIYSEKIDLMLKASATVFHCPIVWLPNLNRIDEGCL